MKSVLFYVTLFLGLTLMSCSSSQQDQDGPRGTIRTPASVDRCLADCENYPRNSQRVVDTCKSYCTNNRSINGTSR